MVNAIVAAIVSVLCGGTWGWAALAIGTAVFMAILFAGFYLADRARFTTSRTEASVAHHLAAMRDGAGDCPCLPCAEFEDHAREALAIAADVVPGLVPPDGKPLSRAERRALRGIEAASEKTGACQ